MYQISGRAVFQSRFASSHLMAPEDVRGPLGPISMFQHSPAVISSQHVSLSRKGNTRLAPPWACPPPRSPPGWAADLGGNELPQSGLKDGWCYPGVKPGSVTTSCLLASNFAVYFPSEQKLAALGACLG